VYTFSEQVVVVIASWISAWFVESMKQACGCGSDSFSEHVNGISL